MTRLSDDRGFEPQSILFGGEGIPRYTSRLAGVSVREGSWWPKNLEPNIYKIRSKLSIVLLPNGSSVVFGGHFQHHFQDMSITLLGMSGTVFLPNEPKIARFLGVMNGIEQNCKETVMAAHCTSTSRYENSCGFTNHPIQVIKHAFNAQPSHF